MHSLNFFLANMCIIVLIMKIMSDIILRKVV